VDISALLGISIGIIAIVGTLFVESHSLSIIIQPTAALIVFGGTFGAGLINFSFSPLINAFKDAFLATADEKANTRIVVEQIAELADIAREQGALVLESLSFAIADPFLQKSLQLSLDTNNGKVLENILNSEIEFEQENSMVSPYVLESLGGYAPTFGIIGAVIGLIHVMSNLTNPSQLGYGISTAFVATIYGVGAANLIFLPLAGKLKLRLRDKIILKKIILEGVLSIHKCENPLITREKVYSYLR
jgi:chemotaxis protein MotA